MGGKKRGGQWKAHGLGTGPKDMLQLGKDDEKRFKKEIERVPGEVRKSWNRDLWWLHSINWKREGHTTTPTLVLTRGATGLSDAERYHQPFRYCFDDAACWQPPRRCTQKPLTVYQAPPDYANGWVPQVTVRDESCMAGQVVGLHDIGHSAGPRQVY